MIKRTLRLCLELMLLGWSGSAILAQETTLFLPHFTFRDGAWTTTLVLSNPTLFAQTVSIDAYANDGQLSTRAQLSLPPLSSINGPVTELIAGLDVEVGWLEMDASSTQIKGIMKFTAVQGGASSLPRSQISSQQSSWRKGFG